MLDIINKGDVLDITFGGGITLNGETPITLETLYKTIPIGKEIILYTTDHPVDLYGGGNWEQICECFTFAGSKLYDDNGNLISESNRTYKADGVVRGEFEHTLKENEMPSHNHAYKWSNSDYWSGIPYVLTRSACSGNADAIAGDGYDSSWSGTALKGGSQPHNNMPPYQVGYKWKRIG